MRLQSVILVLCATHLSACTAVPPNEAPPESTHGPSQQYFLPKSVFEVQTKFTLNGCSAKKLENGQWIPDLDIDTEIEIVEKWDADTSRSFMLRGDDIVSWRSDSKIIIKTYSQGTIKSISTTQEDKTGTVAANIVTAVGKLMPLAALAIADSAAVAKGTKEEIAQNAEKFCNNDVVKTIDAVKSIDDEISIYIKYGSKIKPDPKIKYEDTMKTLEQKIKYLKEVRENLLREKLVFIVKKRFSPSPNRESPNPNTYSTPIYSDNHPNWLSPDGIEAWIRHADTNVYLPPKNKDPLTMHIYLVPGKGTLDVPDEKPIPDQTLVLRPPISSKLHVCLPSCLTSGPDSKFNADNVEKTATVWPSQFAPTQQILLKTKWFENRADDYEFAESGAFTSFAVGSKSRAASATGSASTILESAGTATSSIRYADEDIEIAKLKKKKEMLQLNKDIKDLEK